MSEHKRPSSLLRVDAEDRIVTDVLCVRCGRSLRGLLVTERCPDCRHPASDSVHGDYLIYSDREMVKGLAESARLIEYGCAVLGVLVGLGLLAAAASADSLEAAVDAAYNIIFAGAILSPIVATLGLVLLTTRHTAAYYWVRYGNPRALLRLGLLFALVLAIIAIARHYFGVVALQVGIVFWFALPLAAFLRGLERLMRRVPNNQLAAYARATFVGLLAFAALSVLVIVLRDGALSHPSWLGSQLAFTAIDGLGGLILGVAAFVLVVRVRRTLFSIVR